MAKFKGKNNKNQNQQQRKREYFKRKHQHTADHMDMGNDEAPPVKKKPLLQTPMEERPICKFFKEGKCQKVSGLQ